MQQRFLDSIDGVESFKLLFDLLPNVAFYIKDCSGRIMAINRWNCMNCNIPNEMEAIGKTSYDLFSPSTADTYYKTDMQVIKTGKPVFNMPLPAPDYSTKLIFANKVPVFDKNKKVIGVATAYHCVNSTSNPSVWNKRLSAVVEYIHDHYTKQLKTETLALIAGLSPTHLKRVFNRLFGMPPIEYVILTRVNAARELLEVTNRTVSDIAQEVGFYDHSHFNRHFKHHRGCTPTQYRKRYRTRDDIAKKPVKP